MEKKIVRDVNLEIEITVSPRLLNVYRDRVTGWFYIADRKGLPHGGTQAYETRTAAWKALRKMNLTDETHSGLGHAKHSIKSGGPL